MKTTKKTLEINNFLRQKMESTRKCDNTYKNFKQIAMDQLYQGVCNFLNPSVQLSALTKIYDNSTSEKFCGQLINYGLLKRIAGCLNSNQEEIQHIATCILANIAVRTKHVAITKEYSECYLLRNLRSSNVNIRQQSLRALSNIASDVILEYAFEVLKTIYSIVSDDFNSILTLRIISQVVCNMCNENISMSVLQQILPILERLIKYTDEFILPCVTTTFFLLTGMGSEHLDFLIKTGFVARLMTIILSNDYFGEQHIALKTIGNLAASTEEHKEALLNGNILSYFPILLLKENDDIVCEDATFIVSKIALGNLNQKQAVIDAGLLPLVIENLNRGRKKLKLKSMCVITNMFTNSTQQQKEIIMDCNPVIGLCILLEYDYINPIKDVLDCLFMILKHFGESDRIPLKIDECGGLEKLRILADQNISDEVQLLSKSILDTFFYKFSS